MAEFRASFLELENSIDLIEEGLIKDKFNHVKEDVNDMIKAESANDMISILNLLIIHQKAIADAVKTSTSNKNNYKNRNDWLTSGITLIGIGVCVLFIIALARGIDLNNNALLTVLGIIFLIVSNLTNSKLSFQDIFGKKTDAKG